MFEALNSLTGDISKNFVPAIILIVILMPFWYMAIYLFQKDFYSRSPHFLVWIFSFCFSFVWFCFFGVITILLPEGNIGRHMPLPDGPGVPLIQDSIAEFYFHSGFMSIFAIFFIISYGYFRRHKGKKLTLIPLFIMGSTGIIGASIFLFIISRILK